MAMPLRRVVGHVGQAVAGQRLGDAEIDDLRLRRGVMHEGQHVAGLDVAVEDRLLVRVRDRVADLHEQTQAVVDRQPVVVAEARDRAAGHVFHDEVRPPGGGAAGIEHLRDVRMIHARQRLPLGVEARDHFFRIHAELHDLQRDDPPDRVTLLGLVDGSEPAFAEFLEDGVRADRRADERVDGGSSGENRGRREVFSITSGRRRPC